MKLLARKPEVVIGTQGVSTVEKIQIGGIDQYISIQSADIRNPILFIVHGGPSMPIPGVSNRGTDYALIMCTKELVQHFTLVYWDQRGTGKSYSKDIPKDTMHLMQFVSDANEVTDYLLSRFKQPKLHLVGHSWGSIIALRLISQYPEKFYSYTGFSQITNWVENDKLSYRWLLQKAKEANDQKVLKQLTEIGEPPYLESFKQWGVLRRWLVKYKSMVYDAGDNGSATYLKPVKIMLKSPDYSLMDMYNSLIRGFQLSYSEKMMDDINHFDFFSEVPKVEVPVVFIHGEKETHVFPELLQKYYQLLEAPHKQVFWAKKSSHAFHEDDAREIEQYLIENLPKFEGGPL